jgi:hypothetical protein
MLRHKFVTILGTVIVVTGLIYLAGCTSQPDQPEQKPQVNAPGVPKADKHAHKPGKLGGIIVEIGADNYHAEAVFEKTGLLKLYTLGKDENRVIDVESQTLTAHVKEASASASQEVMLDPVPRPSDAKGRTSQFVGKLPVELVGKSLDVTIPIITINGERFRVAFTSAAPHPQDTASHLGADAEKELYLKPGGIYTEADIRANGNQTASQKFKGLKSRHDDQPKIGDKTCPISSGNKTNPQCTWVVNGQTYEFCCPPCVDEFVQLAKQQPNKIKSPSDYVFQGK